MGSRWFAYMRMPKLHLDTDIQLTLIRLFFLGYARRPDIGGPLVCSPHEDAKRVHVRSRAGQSLETLRCQVLLQTEVVGVNRAHQQGPKDPLLPSKANLEPHLAPRQHSKGIACGLSGVHASLCVPVHTP